MKKAGLLLLAATLIVGCAKKDSTGENDTMAAAHGTEMRDHKADVKRFLDAVNAKDSAAMMAMTADNFTDHNAMEGSDPGKAGMAQMFQMMWQAFPDMKIDAQDIRQDGDIVSIRSKITGTWKGDFMGMKANNKPFDVGMIEMVKMTDDGKATDRWGYTEDMKMMQQLGMMPTPSAPPASKK